MNQAMFIPVSDPVCQYGEITDVSEVLEASRKPFCCLHN